MATYPEKPATPKRAEPLNAWPELSIVGETTIILVIKGILRLISEINKGILRIISSSKQNTLRVTSEVNKGTLRLTSQVQLIQ